MDIGNIIYRDICIARKRREKDRQTTLSLQMAFQRLQSTGLSHVAIVAVPREIDRRKHLDHIISSLALGRIALHITWKNPDNDERVAESVYLVPTPDAKQIVAINRYAAAIVFEILDDDFDLAALIQNLHPGLRLAEVNLPPSSFVEALAQMNAGIDPII